MDFATDFPTLAMANFGILLDVTIILTELERENNGRFGGDFSNAAVISPFFQNLFFSSLALFFTFSSMSEKVSLLGFVVSERGMSYVHSKSKCPYLQLALQFVQ